MSVVEYVWAWSQCAQSYERSNMEEITFFMHVHSVREVRGENRPETPDPWPQEWEVRADTNSPLLASLFYRTNQAGNLPRADSAVRVVVGPHEVSQPPQSSD